jgi:thiamine biosynthesis lipoprotein ApbE
VTVKAPTCLAADAAATAVFGMSEARAAALLKARPEAEVVRTV